MLQRAIYLRKAIDKFIVESQLEHVDLSHLRLSPLEWEQVEVLITILDPFKQASINVQKPASPRIDDVFWTYERLFNRIDKLRSTLGHSRHRGKV
jgi:hypothetical protein